jgi:L-iditol 2-dehydrogenase
MLAAVYSGRGEVKIQPVPIPEIGAGEILIRVEACGICHTDLKKIEFNLLSPPRIYGHETAGVVVKVGAGVRHIKEGDGAIVFHHIPCLDCFYCRRKLYAQCRVYKKVGVTAGFEPAGGGFAQYVRVMDWIVGRGVEIIPSGVPFEQACFVEPINTCLKAVVQAEPREDDFAVVLGQGPIGLMFTMLLANRRIRTVATDTMPSRQALSRRMGAAQCWDPRTEGIRSRVMDLTEGRGADLVFVAASVPGIVEEAVRYSRPGAKIMLFAQTSDKERIEVSGAAICKDERSLLGAYSASVDLQKESADLVFSGALPVKDLVSHVFPLTGIMQGMELARKPTEESLKILVRPQQPG